MNQNGLAAITANKSTGMPAAHPPAGGKKIIRFRWTRVRPPIDAVSRILHRMLGVTQVEARAPVEGILDVEVEAPPDERKVEETVRIIRENFRPTFVEQTTVP